MKVVRRCRVAWSIVMLLAVAVSAAAQPTVKVARIAALCPTQCTGHPTQIYETVWVPTLREYGWVIGQNLAMEFRNAQGNAEP